MANYYLVEKLLNFIHILRYYLDSKECFEDFNSHFSLHIVLAILGHSLEQNFSRYFGLLSFSRNLFRDYYHWWTSYLNYILNKRLLIERN